MNVLGFSKPSVGGIKMNDNDKMSDDEIMLEIPYPTTFNTGEEVPFDESVNECIDLLLSCDGSEEYNEWDYSFANSYPTHTINSFSNINDAQKGHSFGFQDSLSNPAAYQNWSTQKSRIESSSNGLNASLANRQRRLSVDSKDTSEVLRRQRRGSSCSSNSSAPVCGQRYSSKYRGVSWYKKTGKFCAQIKFNGIRKHLGYFESEERASEAFQAARAKFIAEQETQTGKINISKMEV